MTLRQGEDLSSKIEMEGLKKNLVEENSQVKSLAVEQDYNFAFYGTCQKTPGKFTDFNGFAGVEFVVSIPEYVCDFLAETNKLFLFGYRSVADIIQDVILDSIQAFIEGEFEYQKDIIKKTEASLKHFKKVLIKMAEENGDLGH